MTRFASVQVSVAQPFFDAAPLPLTKLEQLAEGAGMSGAVVSNPTGIVSLHAAERFMVRLDRQIKHPTYFIETLRERARSPAASVANIALPRTLTGVEAITVVAQRISSVLYGAGFLTEMDNDRIWLLRTAGTTDNTDSWPVQQYNLEVGLQSVQEVIGHPVKPRALRLSRFLPRTSLPDTWRDLPVELNRNTMGLVFDLDDLMPEQGSVVVSGPECSARTSSQEANVAVLRACLETYLGHTAPERLSDSMARAFGMSTRSYRRHLERLGLSHRQLVSDARLSKAEALLADPSVPITEIAFELGYTHSSAFTRFFKGRTCRTPQEFRRRASAQMT